MNENLDYVFEVFIELINSLKKMSKNKDEEISLNSIEFLKICLVYLIDKVHFYENESKIKKNQKEFSAETQEEKPQENQRDLLADYSKILDSNNNKILNFIEK